MFSVEFYQTEDGRKPVRDFLLSLEPKMKAKLVDMLRLLGDKGSALRPPYTKAVEDGIFELRVSQGSNITRAMFFFYVGNRIIVTNGFVKKQQETPKSEIALAKARRKDFLAQEEKRKRKETE